MNPQELRNLQEAYLEVYEESDIKDRDEKSSKQKADDRMVGAKQLSAHQINLGVISKDEGEKRLSKLKKNVNKQLQKRGEKVRNRNTTFSRTRGDDALRMGKSSRNQNEEADLYDIILSHLLDEGYAETPEAAEKIMVNMSEEWREDIMEGVRPGNVEEPLNKVTFKKRRRSLAGKEERDDAKKRGHVDRLTGKPYGTEEAASRRRNLNPAERESRRKFAEDPD